MSGSVPLLLPLHAFMEWTGTTLSFIIQIRKATTGVLISP
jgi:hypothetical protein